VNQETFMMKFIDYAFDWLFRKIDKQFPVWDNRRVWKDYYISEDFRHHKLTPEEVRIIEALEENQKCSDCHLRLWTCSCNLDVADFV
jgi:hypothetical protein